MQLFIRHSIFLIIITFKGIFSFSQNSDSDFQNIIKISEEKYGVNDVLVNGKLYFPLHKDAEGHPYYPQNEFIPGKIYINNQVFSNIPIKYDIEQQKMIIKDYGNDKSLKLIVLNPSRIDSIIIDKRIFIPSNKISSSLVSKRYFELIWDSEFQFVIYHHSSFDSKLNRRNIIPGGYSAIYSDKIFIKNNKIIYINNKRTFFKLFKTKKKEVQDYFKSHNLKYKKANNLQLKQLMQYCYENALFY